MPLPTLPVSLSLSCSKAASSQPKLLPFRTVSGLLGSLLPAQDHRQERRYVVHATARKRWAPKSNLIGSGKFLGKERLLLPKGEGELGMVEV